MYRDRPTPIGDLAERLAVLPDILTDRMRA
jgi:hypothetical protein